MFAIQDLGIPGILGYLAVTRMAMQQKNVPRFLALLKNKLKTNMAEPEGQKQQWRKQHLRLSSQID
jgi:hypothetical protein